MYTKQTKRLKWQKIALVGLMTLITLVATIIPCFGASAGLDGDNYPTIPMYLELRYPDKAVFLNLTDRYYYNDTTNHDYTLISGRELTTTLYTKSIRDDGVLMRKGISSEYSLAPNGFTLSCPTFYLTRNQGVTSFNQVRPYIKIPETVNFQGVLTYDVYFGGTERAGAVFEYVESPLGESTDVYLFSFQQIDDKSPEHDWTSVRIDNLQIESTTFSFGGVDDNTEILAGNWIIDSTPEPSLPTGESVNQAYFPFTSNGRAFSGMIFGDTVYLTYFDTVGTLQRLEVWNTTMGWLNEEYRTIYISSDVTWNDVVIDTGIEYIEGGDYLKEWLHEFANKVASVGGYDGQDLLQWRYQVQTNNYINAYRTAYENEYMTSIGDSSEIYQEGFNAGEEVGFDKGFEKGYQKAVSETNPDLTSWLTVATGGILSFEILPNITLLDILGIIITIALVIALLKFFAGG